MKQGVRLFVCGDFRAKNTSLIHIDDTLKDIITKSDFSICNFEAPVETNGNAIMKSGPSLYQDRRAPEFVKALGFNVILLANNHIMDYGIEGCNQTIEKFSDCVCVGAGKAKDAYQVKIVEKEGAKIGFLSLVQHEFGVVESPYEEETYGTAWINSLDVEDIIRDARSQVDYLIIFPHAGVEHTDAPLPEWRRLYKKMTDWGADAVIASHPHCPQGWELHRGKYIFYSLGNFYFDELEDGHKWYNSIAVEILINNEMKVKTHNLIFNSEGTIEIDSSQESKDYIGYLNNLLSDNELYNNYINRMCIDFFQGFRYGLLRGVCGFTFRMRFYYALRLFLLMLMGNKDEMYLLNVFQNESHRWLLEKYLNNNK